MKNFVTYADQFNVRGVVSRTLATRRRDVSYRIFKITTVRRYLIAEEDIRQLPVINVVVTAIMKIVVDYLAIDRV